MRSLLKSILLIFLLAGAASAEVVQGTVLEDHSGSPVPTAAVKLKTGTGTTLKELDTDRTGNFVFPDIPAGEYLVSVTKGNYATVNARMSAQSGSSFPILRLIKYGVISGHLTSPRTGGAVTAIEEVPAGQVPRSYSGTADSAGNFRIFGIAPGRYQLSAPLNAATLPTPPRGIAFYPSNAKPREFVITGGEEYSVPEFTVPADGMSFISGKVTGPGTPQIFSLSLIESEHPSMRLMTALTATTEDGTFHFDSVLPGTYDLYATGPVTPPPSLFARVRLVLNGQKVENMDIVLKPGRTVELAMSSGKAAAPNSLCSPDGVLTLQAIGTWALVRDLKFTAPISPTTPAHIENVPPGPFTVNAQSTTGNCFGVTTTVLDLRNDITPERITVRFQPLGAIHGNAAAGSVVVLRDMTPGRESTQAIVAASGKEYRFDGLAPGQYCVATQSATDAIPHWSPEPGCATPIVNLAPGESKGL